MERLKKILIRIRDFCRQAAKRTRIFLLYVRKFLTIQLRSKGKKDERGLIVWSTALHLILLPLVFLYYEVLLRLLNGTGVFRHLIFPVLFGISLGLFLTAFAVAWKKILNRRITLGIMLVTAVVFTVECMIRSTFQVYMTFGSVAAGGNHVVMGFGSLLVKVILRGFLTILLYLIPSLLYYRLGKKHLPARQYKPLTAAALVLLSVLFLGMGSALARIGHSAGAYTSQYTFDSAVRTFGLITGFRLDLSRGGAEAELAVSAAETQSETEDAAEEETKAEAPVIYGENVLDIDFAALETEDSRLQSMNQYVSSRTPSKQNAYTGLFEGKNLILICAEAFSDSVIDEKLTPTLYRLTHKGIYFSEYYQPAWGGSTITGECSFLLGLAPLNEVETSLDTIGNNNYLTLGNQLQRLGYYSAAFHNGSYTYYDRYKTHENLGYSVWMGHGNGLEELAGPYPTDEDMMALTLDAYMDKQPFSIYYLTLAGHAPYEANDEYTAANIGAVRAVYGDTYKNKTTYYLCYQLELEKALTTLVEKLEAAGIADDTVICLTADHYPYGLAYSSTFGNTQDYLIDLYGGEYYDACWERDHSALILWSGCLEHEKKDMACEIKDPTFSLDVVPTLSNLFGLAYDSRLLVGRDVFSDTEPLVFWSNYSWITREGSYNSETGKFTPKEGSSVSDDYAETIAAEVKNKLSYSRMVLDKDYFGYLFGEDTEPGLPALTAP